MAEKFAEPCVQVETGVCMSVCVESVWVCCYSLSVYLKGKKHKMGVPINETTLCVHAFSPHLPGCDDAYPQGSYLLGD